MPAQLSSLAMHNCFSFYSHESWVEEEGRERAAQHNVPVPHNTAQSERDSMWYFPSLEGVAFSILNFDAVFMCAFTLAFCSMKWRKKLHKRAIIISLWRVIKSCITHNWRDLKAFIEKKLRERVCGFGMQAARRSRDEARRQPKRKFHYLWDNRRHCALACLHIFTISSFLALQTARLSLLFSPDTTGTGTTPNVK